MESKFAQSLRLLRELHDLQNGAPLIRESAEWEKCMKDIQGFLSEHEDKPESDLDRFVDLYRSFGIECKVNWDGHSRTSRIRLISPDGLLKELDDTVSDKFIGYDDFYSRIEFDKDGKFISQGFWE